MSGSIEDRFSIIESDNKGSCPFDINIFPSENILRVISQIRINRVLDDELLSNFETLNDLSSLLNFVKYNKDIKLVNNELCYESLKTKLLSFLQRDKIAANTVCKIILTVIHHFSDEIVDDMFNIVLTNITILSDIVRKFIKTNRLSEERCVILFNYLSGENYVKTFIEMYYKYPYLTFVTEESLRKVLSVVSVNTITLLEFLDVNLIQIKDLDICDYTNQVLNKGDDFLFSRYLKYIKNLFEKFGYNEKLGECLFNEMKGLSLKKTTILVRFFRDIYQKIPMEVFQSMIVADLLNLIAETIEFFLSPLDLNEIISLLKFVHNIICINPDSIEFLHKSTVFQLFEELNEYSLVNCEISKIIDDILEIIKCKT